MKWLFFIFLFLFLSLSLAQPVFAAKIRVRKPRATKSSISYSSVSVSPSTHSVSLKLLNLSKVKSVTYELSYAAWDVPQGAMGTIAVAGQTTDGRDLYFGTCSHGVCTPHYGLSSQASLLVCTEMTNGTEWCKRYAINTKRLQ